MNQKFLKSSLPLLEGFDSLENSNLNHCVDKTLMVHVESNVFTCNIVKFN